MNWIAVIVATLAGMAVGFVWYNPKVFGTAWMKSVNMTMEDARSANMFKIFGISTVMTVILSIYFARTMGYHEMEYMTIKHGLFHGLEAFGYTILPVMVTNALYEKRSFTYMAINLGHWAVVFCVLSSIHSVWR
jgi:hypothetical protein